MEFPRDVLEISWIQNFHRTLKKYLRRRKNLERDQNNYAAKLSTLYDFWSSLISSSLFLISNDVFYALCYPKKNQVSRKC